MTTCKQCGKNGEELEMALEGALRVIYVVYPALAEWTDKALGKMAAKGLLLPTILLKARVALARAKAKTA